jgi:hypothetical protein
VIALYVKVKLAWRSGREALARRSDVLDERGRDEENKILNETKLHFKSRRKKKWTI